MYLMYNYFVYPYIWKKYIWTQTMLNQIKWETLAQTDECWMKYAVLTVQNKMYRKPNQLVLYMYKPVVLVLTENLNI